MPSFTQSTLSGLAIANPSSLQFGPDGRLYISQDNGVILAVTVAQDSSGGYSVISREAINLVRFIPNHNDDGTFNSAITTRQVTGILVAGSAENPVIYVSSSDPRIGGGTNKGDTGLDTNSGVLSRLSKDASGNWTKVDLVYGLPRSEENHAVNGMQIDNATGHLLLTVGGQTNAGAPSQEFGYLSDYAYGASVVSIDLAAIEAMPSQTYRGQTYKYALPTVDDPSRSGPSDVVAAGELEVFGGNNGLNQARLTPDSPVQLYASGFRNLYDVAMSSSGHLYGIDNGGNPGWGGPPLYRQPDGSLGSNPTAYPTNAINDGSGSINKAPLHLIEAGYYGGHPTPILANPEGAGLYHSDGTPVTLPADWPPVPTSMANPIAGYYLPPGTDRATVLPIELQTPLALRDELAVFSGSVNGVDDYRSDAFDGEMKGDLIVASLNDDSIYRVDLSQDGETVLGVTNLTPGGLAGGGNALDVHAAPENGPFAGTIWVASYGGGITILTPGATSNEPGSNSDTDGDGLNNSVDPFAVDATNGQGVVLTGGGSLSWTFSQNEPHPGPGGLGNLGFTGIMTNGQASYLDQYDPNKTIMGGAAAGVLMQDISEGTPLTNNQTDAYQFGVQIGQDVGSYIVSTKINNPFDLVQAADNQGVGFFIGTGNQANYISLIAGSSTLDGVANTPTISLIYEKADGLVVHQTFAAPVFGGNAPAVTASDSFVLDLMVDPIAGTVTPAWAITRGSAPGSAGETFVGQGSAITASGDLLAALRGQYTLSSPLNGATPSGLAVGIIGTSQGPGAPFSATWNSINITSTQKEAGDVGTAELTFTPNAPIDISTFNTSTAEIRNLITSGKDLKQVIINLDDAILPDGAFFDPNAAGGNNGKAFQINHATGSFSANASYQLGSPTSGYRQITIDFTGFNPGESLAFSLDIDPTSMLGYGKTVPAGGVSGAELAGSHVTFVFADGSATQADLFGSGVAQADARGLTAPRVAPTISLQGQTTGNVTFPAGDPSILVHGTPGSMVRVQFMTVGQFDVPFESLFDGNSATSVLYETITLDAAGDGTVSASLSIDQVLVVAAAEIDEEGMAISAVSQPLRILEQNGPLSSVIGTDAGEQLDGTDGDEGMDGKGGDDVIISHGGDDLLNGGTGQDRLLGGTGDDIYVVDAPGDQVVELLDNGNDTVRTALQNYALASNVENLIFTGTTNASLTGNAQANALTGGRGSDRLDGLGGADILRGGAGNDTYVVDNIADVVVESFGQGTDRVLSQISYILGDNIETLQLTTSKAISGTGNALANIIIGNAGANVIDGQAGADTLTGGAGNDTFQFERGEADGDRILDFTGAAAPSGDVILFVGYGANATLTQVAESDLYIVRSGAAAGDLQETIQLLGVKNLAAGDYRFAAPPNFAPTNVSLSHNIIYENGAAGSLVGTLTVVDPDIGDSYALTLLNDAAGRFNLDGNRLVTTSGFDYEVNQQFNVVLEVRDGGGNTPQRAFAIEVGDINDTAPQLQYSGELVVNENNRELGAILVSDADHVGGPVGLSIRQDSGDGPLFTIDSGNVLRFVDAPDFEADHGPIYNLVIQAFDGVNTSELALAIAVTDIDESSPNSAPTAISLTPASVAENSPAHSIVGTLALADPDDGDLGTFTLIKNAGGRFAISGDALVVSGPLDFESASAYEISVQGRDSVGHTITRDFTISVTDVVTGDEKTLTGQNDAFTYQAGLSFDRVDGAGGTDIVYADAQAIALGRTGNAFSLDIGADGAMDLAGSNIEILKIGAGSFVVTSSLAGTALVDGHVDVAGTDDDDILDASGGEVTFNISGGKGSDVIIGSSRSDMLDGGLGKDKLGGGLGDDTYFVDDSADVVLEGISEGNDTVITTLLSFTLGANLENLIFGGSKAFTGTGNSLNNQMNGSGGADRLDGLGGADLLKGGSGNDTYVVDNIADGVVEFAEQGTDRVLAQVSFVLGANIENLQLSTSKAIDGMGNELSNILLGNGGINTLDGRGGADALTGGSGNDVFQFQRGEASGDRVTDFTGAGVTGGDILRFIGYGPGAFLTQIEASDQYLIHAGAEYGGTTELLQVAGITSLSASDYLFA